MIIDYSLARPKIDQLREAGVSAAGRYIGWESVSGFASLGMNITKEEADELLNSGISVFLLFEYLADAAAKGELQGGVDAGLADSQLTELGAPPSMCVYFAIDFDIPDYAPGLEDTPGNALEKLGPVGHYFQAIKNRQHAFEVGVYGGYHAVKRVLDAGLATKAWQSASWSDGQIDPRVVLYQTNTTDFKWISGSDIDVRENGATVENFGQWTRRIIPPVEFPSPPVNQPLTVRVPPGATSVTIKLEFS